MSPRGSVELRTLPGNRTYSVGLPFRIGCLHQIEVAVVGEDYGALKRILDAEQQAAVVEEVCRRVAQRVRDSDLTLGFAKVVSSAPPLRWASLRRPSAS